MHWDKRVFQLFTLQFSTSFLVRNEAISTPISSFNYIITQFSTKFKTQSVSSVYNSSMWLCSVQFTSLLILVEFSFFLLLISYLLWEMLPLFKKQKQKCIFFVCEKVHNERHARETEDLCFRLWCDERWPTKRNLHPKKSYK